MKILLVDTAIGGHHKSYLDAITENYRNEYVLLLPKNKNESNSYNNIFLKLGKYDMVTYIRWMFQIKQIVKKEKIDVVHFLYTDDFYRFGGLGFGMILAKIPIISTQHAINTGFIRGKALEEMCRKSACVIVHTKTNKEILEKNGAKNIEKIEYSPIGIMKNKRDMMQARSYFGIESSSVKVLWQQAQLVNVKD